MWSAILSRRFTVQKRYKGSWAGQQTDDQQDPKTDLGHRLRRSRHRSMARRQTHNCLQRGRRVARLYVIVDQVCVAGWSVETVSQVFEGTHTSIAPIVRRTIASAFAAGSWLATFCVGIASVIIVNLVTE